jgi:formyltetrahydrofolate-dependent phosphoribosylglycinamide formyltransferase
MPNPPVKIAVLLSGSGRTLQNFIDERAAGRLDIDIRLVIGSKPGLGGIERAAKAKLRHEVVDRKAFADVHEFSERVFSLCSDAQAELICLAGWLNLLIIPPRYAGKIINIHPALLPSFGGKGMYGHKVHQAVIDYGCKISGCTVHFVDATYDTGPIIMQRTCPVLDRDTPDDLAARVFEQEKIAYPEAIRLLIEGKLQIDGRRVRIS